MCPKSNLFISYPCLMIIYYYRSSFVAWFFIFKYQTLIRHSATIFFSVKGSVAKLKWKTLLYTINLIHSSPPMSQPWLNSWWQTDSAQRLLLWTDACQDSATHWYTSCHYPPVLEPEMRRQAAAASITPTVPSNVSSEPPYICDMATHGALMQHL
jgi:hypothetical protein